MTTTHIASDATTAKIDQIVCTTTHMMTRSCVRHWPRPAPLAQSVEHRPFKSRDQGSSPWGRIADAPRAGSYAGDVTLRATQSRGRRRRRTPEVAEREIVAAADALLRERPFRELTVDEVMRRTGLSRPSFYVYFRDRHQLVLRVVEVIGAELWTMSERWWKGAGDGAELVREAIDGIVALYAKHGPVLRALADAAADDPGVESAYGALVQSFVDVTERHIEDEIAAGHVLPLDARETANALVWMTERCLSRSVGADLVAPRPAMAETLATIWVRTLYGTC